MGEIPTSDPRPTNKEATEGTQATHSKATSGPTPIRKVRIPDEQWSALQSYAEAHSVSTSAALRLALAEFLRGH